MDFKDALRALAEGQNIRHVTWHSDMYVYLANKGIINEVGDRVDIGRATHVQAEWEIYTPAVVKKTVTLWRKPWCESGREWFQPNYRESKEDFSKFMISANLGLGWKYHGEWESVEVEVEE